MFGSKHLQQAVWTPACLLPLEFQPNRSARFLLPKTERQSAHNAQVLRRVSGSHAAVVLQKSDIERPTELISTCQ